MRPFLRNQNGSITMYMVVMSILLFGSLGLILDSGRVYTTHSQMQSLADHVALAAANELDGRPDALQRAITVAFQVAADVPGVENNITTGNQNTIEQLTFYSELSDTSRQAGTAQLNQWDNRDSSQFVVFTADSLSDAESSLSSEAAPEALFVTATVKAVEVRTLATLMNRFADALGTSYDEAFGSTSTTPPERSTGASVSANATAGMEVLTCLELSPLVFCNPWEGMNLTGDETDRNGNPTAERIAQEPVEGRSLMYFAPNYAQPSFSSDRMSVVSNGTAHGSVFNYDVNNQLMTMSDPFEDSAQVCGLDYLQRYFALPGESASTEGSVDYLEVRDRCMLARARAERVCFSNNTIGVRPASGPTVSAAVNTAFDIWNEPLNQVIESTEIVPDADLQISQFFEPDLVVSHAYERMTDLPTPVAGQPDVVELDGIIDNDDYEQFGYQTIGETESEADRAARNAMNNDNFKYTTMPAPYMRRLNTGIAFTGGVHPCHQATLETAIGAATGGTAACSDPFIGDNSYAPSTTYVAAVADYYGKARNDRAVRRLARRGPWYDIYEKEREEMAQGLASTLGEGATDKSHANGDIEDGPPAAANFPPLDEDGNIDTSPDAEPPTFRGDNVLAYLLRDTNATVSASTRTLVENVLEELEGNDAHTLKTSPLDPNGHHDYPLIAHNTPGTHPMESFGVRTGKTSLSDPDLRRRVLTSAFVNCGAAVANGLNDEGLYDAEIVGIYNVFMPRPAGYYCGQETGETRRLTATDPTSQQVSLQTCPVTDQIETQMFVELINEPDITPIVRNTVQLVR